MDTKQIEIYINEYIEKLTMEIIDECILKKMGDGINFIEVCKILFASNDKSLLKKQILFSNRRTIDKVIQDGNKFKISIEDVFKEFTSSTFEQASILFEKSIDMTNLSKGNYDNTKNFVLIRNKPLNC